MVKKNSLFLDRDGVINSTEDGFVNDIADFVFCEGAIEAINILSDYFKYVFVVTNQAGVGYGYMSKKTLENIHHYMVRKIENGGGKINAVYYCPDRVSKSSPCRKPNSGMALQAQKEFPHVVFDQSWMVGDMESDIEFGKRLDMKTAKIMNLHGEQAVMPLFQADLFVGSLYEFALHIRDIVKE